MTGVDRGGMVSGRERVVQSCLPKRDLRGNLRVWSRSAGGVDGGGRGWTEKLVDKECQQSR